MKHDPSKVLCRVTFADACAFVTEHHWHHKKPQGYVVAIGCRIGGELVAVAMLGHPVARHKDDGKTLELIRLCVRDGFPNVASWLLARAKRLAHAMGSRLITYTLASEGGASLRAAGFALEVEAGGGQWSRPSRPRRESENDGTKHLWTVAQMEA